MATRFPRSSVTKLLFHFRSTVSCEALNALEERDADWRRENDALRAENRTLDADYRELLLRYRWVEEELSKQTCMRKSMEEDIECFTEKERWLQGKVRCLETELLNLGRDKKEELHKVLKEKAGLEAKLLEAEVQLAKHQSLVRTVNGMKKEIDDFEYALGQVKVEKNEGISNERHGKAVRASEVSQREKSDDIQRISGKKMSVEVERRRIKEKEEEKIQELNRKVEALEMEKGEIEAQLRRTKTAMSTETERILNEKMALETQNRRTEEELKEKILQLANNCEVLEAEKGVMENELCHALHEKIVSKEKISELVNSIVILEDKLCKANQEKKSEIERIMKENRALEVERRTSEGRINALEIGKRQSKMSNKEKQQIINKLLKEKKNLEAEMRKLQDDRKLANKERQQVKEESKYMISDLVKRIEVLMTQTKEMETQVIKAKTDMKSESELLKKALDDQKSRMHDAEKRVSEISKTVEDLKREKGALEAQLREKSEEIRKILKDKMDLEAKMRIMEDQEKRKFLESTKKVDVLMREKIEMEAELSQANKDKIEENKKSLGLANRIVLLEREKQGLEAQVREKSEEITMILKDKMDLEAEKRDVEDEEKRKFLELTKRVDVLMTEKIEMEDEFCQANKAKSEENKKSVDLANKIALLEREKKGLEAEIMDKDEVIKVVAQENSSLENVIKKLNMELANSLISKCNKVKEVQLSQPVYHPGNVGMLNTSWQTQAGQGKKTVGGCKRKRTDVRKHKHKRQFSEGSSAGRCSGIVNSNSGGEVETDASKNRKSAIWEVEEDLLAALDSSPELCLQAICALYRQHLLSMADHPVFNPDDSSKAVALAEYLVDDDPSVRLRKSVADLEQLDPLAVVACRDIAKQHYKQVFQISLQEPLDQLAP